MLQTINKFGASILLITAMVVGAVFGQYFPNEADSLSSAIDPMIIILVSILFFEISFSRVSEARHHKGFLSLAWAANFLIVPFIGWAIAGLFMSGKPQLLAGLLIYFMAPCTDWFLGFTRMARGNVGLGTVLIPINLITQLILFPVYIGVFMGTNVGADMASIWDTLLQWFLIPFLVASSLHLLLKRFLSVVLFEKILHVSSKLVPVLIAGLVALIFSNNITIIFQNITTFLMILCAVFVFFVATYFLSEFLSRRFRLSYTNHVLLTMTTAARNAPLMLGLATAIFPDRPLLHAAIIIGMLVEFPHLIILKQALLRRRSTWHEETDKSKKATLNQSSVAHNL